MRKLALLAVVFTACVPLTASADDHVVVSAGQLKWVAAPPSFPKGAQIAVLSGDPSKEGLYVVRLKAPAGYKVPAHTHPFDEQGTVISGSVAIAMGEKVDEKAPAQKAGGFFKMPKGMVHFAYFPEETILQIHGQGPQGLTYVNAADDPRKQN